MKCGNLTGSLATGLKKWCPRSAGLSGRQHRRAPAGAAKPPTTWGRYTRQSLLKLLVGPRDEQVQSLIPGLCRKLLLPFVNRPVAERGKGPVHRAFRICRHDVNHPRSEISP